jgi:UDP-2,4-diacetamido-2,4,6-trideoxy-beta-L-altropyranose hydrolase
MKVFIITEGSRDIGFGHITRCTSLYQAFEEKSISPVFIIRGDETVRDFLRDISYKIFNWIEEVDNLFDFIKNADVAIIDSYLADYEFYKKISNLIKLPVYIDDNRRIDYPRGIVINGTIYAEEMDYPVKKDVTYLLGSKYIPIRKEFWYIPEKKINENINSILITFGGDDARNITPKVLTLLTKGYLSLTKNVIIGKGFKNVEEIKSASDGNTNLLYYPQAEGMKNIMLESDIAISASGQTLYELAGVGVPAIAVAVADNQMNNVKGWQKAGFIEYAGLWENKDILENIKNNLNILEDRRMRERISKIGKIFVDGKGARRIVEEILNRC